MPKTKIVKSEIFFASRGEAMAFVAGLRWAEKDETFYQALCAPCNEGGHFVKFEMLKPIKAKKKRKNVKRTSN